MIRNLTITVILGLVAAIAYYLYITPNYGTGQIPSDFSWTVDGSEQRLSDLHGQYVLLHFWGSWCPPCRRNNPEIVKLYRDFHDESYKDADNFTIVSVGIETNPERYETAKSRDGLSWPHHYSDFQRLQGKVARDYGIREIPAYFFIHPDGHIITVNPKLEAIRVHLESSRINN